MKNSIMPGIDAALSDEDYLIMRAKEAQKIDVNSAKAWMITAKTLYPNNFNVQFEAYLMEKQSNNVHEAAESFSAMLASKHNISSLLTEIEAIASALKSNESNFLSQMFDKICPDMQLLILKTSVENNEDTMEHCKLLLLLLKKFPQLGVDSLVKTLIGSEKCFQDNRYARLLVVETLPLLNSLESPRLLQRLLLKAIDFYNTYIFEDSEHDISDPWVRLYGIIDLLGRQLGWESYLLNYSNVAYKDIYLQKLSNLRTNEDCRQLLYCGLTFLLKQLYDQKTHKGSVVLLEALSDPDMPQVRRSKGDVEVTGLSASHFQAAATCWELLNCNEVVSREFLKLSNQLQLKPWMSSFINDLALYRGRFDEILNSLKTEDSLATNLVKVSIYFTQKNYTVCMEHILTALACLPSKEGIIETDLIIGGLVRHLHFLPLTKAAIIHYFCTVLIRILLSNGGNTDIVYGHILVLMQLGWPQEEAIFIHIMNNIKQKAVFRYPLFMSYLIHIDILEEFSFLWNDQGHKIVLDILPNSQQHLGQRRISTRGTDKGAKEDFKQAMKGQVARSNESVVNLIVQFLNQERSFLLQL